MYGCTYYEACHHDRVLVVTLSSRYFYGYTHKRAPRRHERPSSRRELIRYGSNDKGTRATDDGRTAIKSRNRYMRHRPIASFTHTIVTVWP